MNTVYWLNMQVRETDLTRMFIERVPFAIPSARAWYRNIVDDMSARGHKIVAGVPGQADVFVYAKGGKVVEIEAKMAKGRMREAQLAWAAFCKAWGIPHMVLRQMVGEEPVQTVERWCQELKAVLG
jgi:hypothetical protein